MLNSAKLKNAGSRIAISAIALVLSILVGAIIVAALGKDPITVYSALFEGAFGGALSLTGTFNRMIPIVFAGLAIAVGQKCSVFNIGVDGQILIGSLISVYMGAFLNLPPIIHIPLTMVVGALGGMLWSMVPALLNLKKNVSVVFSTIMMNYVAQYLCNFLIQKMPGYVSNKLATPNIQDSTAISNLFPTPWGINSGILISLLAVVVIYIYVFRTRAGYDLRAAGFNRHAARSAGINIKKNVFMAMMVSGLLAGFAGSTEVAGLTHCLVENYAPGYMATGIAVAMLGQGNPFAILLASFLFAGMKNGAPLMQMKTGMSNQFVSIVQGLIIVFICSENFIRWIYIKLKTKKKVRENGNGSN